MTHKEWLDNEYNMWIEALQESTVHNFKEHPMVKRMLSEVDRGTFEYEPLDDCTLPLVQQIDHIGYTKETHMIDGACERMIYWAQQVLKRNPKSIVEIGGGVGEFYAILRALGYKGEYGIYDLIQVEYFQKKYLKEVSKVTGLNLDVRFAPAALPEGYKETEADFLCSFYAFGEFDDETKEWYVENIINHVVHGLIVWNPHSGASSDFPKTVHNVTIDPTIEENITKVTW